MNFSSLKFKLIAIIAGTGIMFTLLLAVFAPYQAKSLGRGVMEDNVSFVTGLLAENLAIGLQTVILDDGAALQETLKSLKQNESEKESVISEVCVYDESNNLVLSLSGQEAVESNLKISDKLEVVENKHDYLSCSPLTDLEGTVLGYVSIRFSKQNLDNQASKNAGITLLVAFGALCISITIGYLISRSVGHSTGNLIEVMKDIADGEADLTKRINLNTKDELGELSKWFDTFLDRLHLIIKQVASNTEQVATASSEISATSEELASGSEEQNSQTSDVAAAVEEMTAAILENARNATHTAQISEQASTKAQEGAVAMQETRKGMEEIVLSTSKTSDIINSLSGRADQIGEIIQVINDIADQTNLLALNAAIEAARAGEQGRGFAVVADEVRKLAERTTKATSEVGETIKAIQEDTKNASKSMEEADAVVSRGKQATVKTEEVLGEIMQSVARSMEMINQIAAATEEMSSGAEDISKNVDSISNVTKESAYGAEALAATAGGLTQQTESLRNLVGQFKLE
ncbi:HAMP domain-containing protein [bacterium]|nr:HAMP domain-containing protein [bacterium]